MSLVLYRKYRPKSFSETIGQEHIVQTLTNAISTGIISHAYLFCGPRGSGKTTFARLLAKALNCTGRNGNEGDENKSSSSRFAGARDFEPCNKCSSCLEIMNSRSMDLIEIDAASHRGIDEMKELIEGIKFSPSKSKYKVFIIDESHQLTKEAANALLKTLEEPPPHAIFILATTEIHKMITTIVSRCQRFDFRKLTLEEIVKRLDILAKKEKVKVDKTVLELIALNSGGAFRDAEGLLGQAISFCGQDKEITVEEIKNLLGLVEIEMVSKFCDYLVEKNISGAISFLNTIIEKGTDLQEFVKALINYLRQGLILKITGDDKDSSIIAGLTKEEIEKLKGQSLALKEEELRNILNLFLEAEGKMKYSPILQLPLELAIIEAIGEKE